MAADKKYLSGRFMAVLSLADQDILARQSLEQKKGREWRDWFFFLSNRKKSLPSGLIRSLIKLLSLSLSLSLTFSVSLSLSLSLPRPWIPSTHFTLAPSSRFTALSFLHTVILHFLSLSLPLSVLHTSKLSLPLSHASILSILFPLPYIHTNFSLSSPTHMLVLSLSLSLSFNLGKNFNTNCHLISVKVLWVLKPFCS